MPQCMPDIYKRTNSVDAYRAYYMGEEKRHIMKWGKSRPSPHWFNKKETISTM